MQETEWAKQQRVKREWKKSQKYCGPPFSGIRGEIRRKQQDKASLNPEKAMLKWCKQQLRKKKFVPDRQVKENGWTFKKKRREKQSLPKGALSQYRGLHYLPATEASKKIAALGYPPVEYLGGVATAKVHGGDSTKVAITVDFPFLCEN